MRVLHVGDLHVEAKDLKSSALPAFLENLPALARELRCDGVMLLGDSGHTHDVLNSFVQFYFRRLFDGYGKHDDLQFGVVIGNHDQASITEPWIHALSAFTMPRNVTVFDKPTYSSYFEAVVMPYMHDNDEFVREAEALRVQHFAQTLICHQTFAGACYENKFMAAGGVDTLQLGFKRIISGHIHMRQDFGVVHYPGTPRWKTASDYNERKSLTVFDAETNALEFVDSSRFFAPWRRFYEKQSEVKLETIPILPETEVVVEGDQEFVANRSAYWSALGVRVRSRVIGSKVAVSVNSGKAIGQLLSDYADAAELRNGSDRDAVKSELGRYL